MTGNHFESNSTLFRAVYQRGVGQTEESLQHYQKGVACWTWLEGLFPLAKSFVLLLSRILSIKRLAMIKNSGVQPIPYMEAYI
jgi:hypothetical protein